MDTALLNTVPESYAGPKVENPVLREWTHLTGLPFGSLISVDGVIFESCTEPGDGIATFAVLGDENGVAVPAEKLLQPFIGSQIVLLRLGL